MERYRQERSKPGLPKKPRRAHRDGAVDQPHNLSQHAARNASYAFEISAAARPSRKSTRKSKNRQKPDSALQLRQTRRTTLGERSRGHSQKH